MSGEPNSQRPETYDVGNLALNDGRLNFQLEPKPKQPVPSSPDFLNFLSTYEEDESEPVLGEEELKVNKTWVTGVADTKRDLSVRGSWEYDRLLFLSKLSLDRVAGRIGSTDSEIADAKSYMEFALDDRCNVHDDDRFRATSLLGQAYLASFRNQSTITFLKDSITYHLKAVTLCPEDSPQRVAVLIAYSESLLEGIRYEGGPEKLQRTFDALEEALRLCPQESDEYVQILHNIGISHVFRFDQTRLREISTNASQISRHP
ncbi:hypothetical protein NLI96_g6719 [Meripilus lineatus]|uniref:Uncharacterized protein n=1 Tax=Meripilus lineatus TaxID=2056292 RepID=A0AAD5V0Q7_9APHY|nr:hypothetical protein NLI96_g6719 [Physisporinus lineatus]